MVGNPAPTMAVAAVAARPTKMVVVMVEVVLVRQVSYLSVIGINKKERHNG
jgi:hypothetical protein